MQLDGLGKDSSNLNDLYKLTAAGTGIFVKDVRTLPSTNLERYAKELGFEEWKAAVQGYPQYRKVLLDTAALWASEHQKLVASLNQSEPSEEEKTEHEVLQTGIGGLNYVPHKRSRLSRQSQGEGYKVMVRPDQGGDYQSPAQDIKKTKMENELDSNEKGYDIRSFEP